MAQQQTTATAPKDTTKLLRHIALSVDIVGTIQSALSNYGHYEAAVRLSIRNQFFPVLELGFGQADSEDPNTKLHYTSKAPFGRVGLDYNMLKNKNDDYRLYGGVRYGFSTFKYTITHPETTDPVWHTTQDFILTNLPSNTHWAELVGGVDAKIWGPVRLGWSVRYKKRIAQTQNTQGQPWYVPGYGRNHESVWGGTFNVTLEL